MKKIGKNDKKWEKWQKSGKKLQKFDKQLGNFFLKKNDKKLGKKMTKNWGENV